MPNFQDETLVISRQFQNDMLDFCDIDPALYGDEVDLGLLARRPISIIGSALFDHHPGTGLCPYGPADRTDPADPCGYAGRHVWPIHEN